MNYFPFVELLFLSLALFLAKLFNYLLLLSSPLFFESFPLLHLLLVFLTFFFLLLQVLLLCLLALLFLF